MKPIHDAARRAPGARGASASSTRRPYDAPALEHLGSWNALTLQQSVPITLLRLLEQAGYFYRYGE